MVPLKRRLRQNRFWGYGKSPTHALTANQVIGHFGWNADL
jgi:hypothetical protein